MNKGVVVIGAGQAGAEYARVLRQGGFAGSITLFGREAFPPYDRPPLSKRFLHEDLLPDRLLLRSRDAYRDSGVELVTGSVVDAIDPATKTITLANSDSFAFDTCVLATGANARRPDIKGIDLQGVHILRTVEDASNLRSVMKKGAHLVVVGGGYLGLEVASSACSLGVEVTVIEGAPALMQRSISALTAAAIEQAHRARGVRFLFGTSVSGLDGETRVRSVTTSQGEIIQADAVLFAIGAEPAVELAERSGLQCQNGILVDAACRTSAPDIYAIGDCANQLHSAYGRHLRLEAISSALFHARSAAADLLGKPAPAPKPPSFWSEQCGFMLQVLGVPKPGVPCEDVRCGDDSAFSVYRFQEGELAAVESVNRPKDFVRAHALIGKSNITLPID